MRALLLFLLPGLAMAECVLQDRVVQKAEVTIAERAQITTEVVPALNGGRR